MNEDANTPFDYKPGGTEVANQEAVTADTADQDNAEAPPSHSAKAFSWTSVEYIEHERGAGWYVLLLLVTAGIAAATYFISKDYFAVGVIVAAGIIVTVYAGRKPNQITYEITNKGLNIGQKTYPYSTFRSFSVFHEGQLSSVNFLPIKRLMPPIAAYFEPQNEQKIMNVIGDHLPYEEHTLDPIDRLTRRLRF
jgi:hypothetical protein